MTHVEALKHVLEELGGRAHLKEIYPRVVKFVFYKEGSNIQATLRAALQRHPNCFKRSAGMPDGWWELVSYQEDIAKRDRRIKELEDEITRLKAIKTEDGFVKRLVRETKNLYKHEKEKIEVVRQILYKVGRADAEEELDAWIEGREYKPSVNVAGDYVVSKHVENEVNGVAPGAIGIKINKDKQ